MEAELWFPLVGAPWNYYEMPVSKRDKHYLRWLAYGQAEAEEQEYQREQSEKERDKYSK